MKRVENKTVIVTGGASGIGKATVSLLAEEGASVVFCDVKEEEGKKLEAELTEKKLNVVFVCADVRYPEQNEKLVKFAVDKFGKLDAIVTSAGKYVGGKIADIEDEAWIDSIETNCDSAYYLYRYAAPEMVKNGGGSIVFVGDGGTEMALPKFGSNLVAAKALEYLCRQIGVEHARDHIRANIVSPTLVDSDYWKENPSALEVLYQCANGQRKFTADDVAPTILFMVSDESKMLTASNLKLNDNFDCGFAYDQWAGLREA